METKKRSSRKHKVILLLIGLTWLFVYFMFIHAPENDKTRFSELISKQDYNRFKEIVSDKEYEKLQVFVYCENYNNLTWKIINVDELGINSADVCEILSEKGILTKEWISEISVNSIEDLQKEEAWSVNGEAQASATKYIADQLDNEKLIENLPRWVAVGVKRELSHYLPFYAGGFIWIVLCVMVVVFVNNLKIHHK